MPSGQRRDMTYNKVGYTDRPGPNTMVRKGLWDMDYKCHSFSVE